MDELTLMAEVLAGTIEDNVAELRKMDSAGKNDTKMYAHKLGEIAAYEDVLNMLIWRMDKVRTDAMKKGDK